jgi:hypothetical protein
MDGRFLAVGTAVGGVTLGFWGIAVSLASMALPWPYGVVRSFPDDRAAVRVIADQVPENGVYISGRGVFLAISVWPDLLDQREATQERKGILEFLGNLVIAFILTYAFIQVRPSSLGSAVGLLGMFGGAAAVATRFHDWNWYSFSWAYTVAGMLDLVLGWALVGLVLGVLSRFVDRKFEGNVAS